MLFQLPQLPKIPQLDFLDNYSFLNNTGNDYMYAIATFFVFLIIFYIIKFTILSKLKILSKKTKTKLDDLIWGMIDSLHWPFYFLLSIYLGLKYLKLPEVMDKWIDYIIIIILSYYVIKILQSIVDYGTKVIKKKKEDPADAQMADLLGRIAKIALWIIGAVWILSNLGFNVSSLLAGLGIGGIAIAFALQNVLSDIFASFSIYFDKPFKVGDFIIVGNDMGIVEKIGIKSTRIRTLQGQELIVSNKELTETRVNNYKKMDKRRIVFAFGVVYGTQSSKLKKIPKIVADIITRIDLAEINRVHFKEFGAFSLNYEVVYYVNTREYNTYMDIQQKINMDIKEKFEKEKIEMAFPTQTIFLEKPGK